MSRMTLTAAAVAGLAVLAVGQARAEERFPKVVSSEGRFSIEMPGKVQQATRPYKGFKEFLWGAVLPGGVLYVSYFDFPADAAATIQAKSPQAVITSYRQGAVGNGAITHDAELTWGRRNVPGREHQTRDEKGRHVRQRLLLDGTRLYTLHVHSNDPSFLRSPEAERVFQSFTIDGDAPARPSRPAGPAPATDAPPAPKDHKEIAVSDFPRRLKEQADKAFPGTRWHRAYKEPRGIDVQTGNDESGFLLVGQSAHGGRVFTRQHSIGLSVEFGAEISLDALPRPARETLKARFPSLRLEACFLVRSAPDEQNRVEEHFHVQGKGPSGAWQGERFTAAGAIRPSDIVIPSVTAAKAAPAFHQITSAKGRFAVQMPGRPEEQAPQPGKRLWHSYVVRVGSGAGFSVKYVESAAVGLRGSPREILLGQQRGIVDALKGRILDETDSPTDASGQGHGRAAWVHSKHGDSRILWRLSGGRLYMLMAWGPPDLVASEAAQRFFESFTIMLAGGAAPQVRHGG